MTPNLASSISAVRATILMMAAISLSAPSNARDWPRAGGWDIVEGDKYCGVTSEFQGPGDTELTLLLYVDGSVALAATNSGWTVDENEKLPLSYHLNGMVYEGSSSVGLKQSYYKRGFVAGFNPTFVEDFAKSSYLRIYKGETLVDSLDLAGSAAGIAQARRCLGHVRSIAQAAAREKARWAHIPKDPFSSSDETEHDQTEGAKTARFRAGSISTDDYPSAALRDQAEGTVEAFYIIGTDGRVTSCKVTSTSGNAALDDTTCKLIERRFSFFPAQDADGTPVVESRTQRISWNLPN